jgi:hypothetical protein
MTEPSNAPLPEPASEAPEAPDQATPAVLPLRRLLPPPPDGIILAPPEQREPARRGWFLAELGAEMRLAARMYFDPRYRISRLAQIALPLILVAMVVNYFFFSQWLSIWVVSPVLERLIDVVLAVLAYRVLARELDRYRAVLDYLALFSPR